VQEWALNSKTGVVERTGFYVLTTAEGLSGEDLRELAYLRWEIENNIFKRLNHLIGSKRSWSHKPKVMETLLRIWMIGLTLLGAYLFERGWKKFKETWQTLKSTWKAVTRLMMRSLHQLVT
jgi:IS4 transposase